ncbi:MAG: general secretion pathway protein GspK [Oligoflexales bacterium]|nr:general secretion pathway protein GspK [Oligoflexales bacterium]
MFSWQKRFRIKLPVTKYGFPFAENSQSHRNLTPERDVRKKGIALLLAIMIISLLMVFVSDLILSSQVNLELTHQQTNNLKAEYLAKSGANLATFMLTVDYAIDLAMSRPPLNQEKADGPGDIWALINGVPIGGDTAELIGGFAEQFELSENMDEGIINQLKEFQGQFIINIEDESKKINLNACSFARCDEVLAMLQALFACPVEKKFLEDKNLKNEALVANIKDYLDEKSILEAGSEFSDEDAPYGKTQPEYKAKNAPLYSLDELKMVEGWDQDLHVVFSPYFTVFPFKENKDYKPKININTANRELLACLVREAGIDCNDKFTQSIQARDTDKVNVASAGSLKEYLKSMMCFSGKEGSSEAQNPEKWFQTFSDTYRITVSGMAGDQIKTLDLVIQRKIPEKASKIDYQDNLSAYSVLYRKLK